MNTYLRYLFFLFIFSMKTSFCMENHLDSMVLVRERAFDFANRLKEEKQGSFKRALYFKKDNLHNDLFLQDGFLKLKKTYCSNGKLRDIIAIPDENKNFNKSNIQLFSVSLEKATLITLSNENCFTIIDLTTTNPFKIVHFYLDNFFNDKICEDGKFDLQKDIKNLAISDDGSRIAFANHYQIFYAARDKNNNYPKFTKIWQETINDKHLQIVKHDNGVFDAISFNLGAICLGFKYRTEYAQLFNRGSKETMIISLPAETNPS